MTEDNDMTAYREDLIRRFDEFVRWATDAWPNRDRPLTAVDFVEMRETLKHIGDPPEKKTSGALPDRGMDGDEFRQVTPAPWP